MGSCTSVKKARPVYRTTLDEIFSLTRKKPKNKEPTPDEGKVDIEALRSYVKPHMKGLIDHLEANKQKLSETAAHLEKLLESSQANVAAKEHALIMCVLRELVTNLSKFRPKNMSNAEDAVEGREAPDENVEEMKKSRKKKNKMLTFMLKKKKKNKEEETEAVEANGLDMQEAEKKLKKSKKKLKKSKKKKDKGLQSSNLNEHLSRFERSFFEITEAILQQDYSQKMILTNFTCETIIAYAKEIKELDSLSNNKFAKIISLLTDNKLFKDEKCLDGKNIESADLLNNSTLAVYQLGRKIPLNMFLDYKNIYTYILVNLMRIYHSFHTKYKEDLKDSILDQNEVGQKSEILKGSDSSLKDLKKFEAYSIDSRLRDNIFLILEVLSESSFHVNDYSIVVGPLFGFFDEKEWRLERFQFDVFIKINELARKHSLVEHVELFMVEKIVEYLTYDRVAGSIAISVEGKKEFLEYPNCSKRTSKIQAFYLLKKIIKRLSNIYMAFIYIEKLMTCFVQNIEETKDGDFLKMFEKTYKKFMLKIESVSKHVFQVVLSLSKDSAKRASIPSSRSIVQAILSLILVSLNTVQVFQGGGSIPEEIIVNVLKTGEKAEFRIQCFEILMILYSRKSSVGEPKARKTELAPPENFGVERGEKSLEYLSLKKESCALTLLNINNCILRFTSGNDQTNIMKYDKGTFASFCAFLHLSMLIIKEIIHRKEFNLDTLVLSFLNHVRSLKNFETEKYSTAVYIFIWEALSTFCFFAEMQNLVHELDQNKHKNSKELYSLQEKFQGNPNIFRSDEIERFALDLEKAASRLHSAPEVPEFIIQALFTKRAQESADDHLDMDGYIDIPLFEDYFSYKNKKKHHGSINVKGLHEGGVNQSNFAEENENPQLKAHNTSRNSLIMTPKNLSIDLKKEENYEDESELITLDFNGDFEKEIGKTIPTNPDNKILDSSYEDAYNQAQSKKKRRNNLNNLLDLDK